MSRATIRNAALAVAVLAGVSALVVAATSTTPLPARDASHRAPAEALATHRGGETSFPGESWAHAEPADLGWSAEGLESARRWAEGLDTGAVFVVHRGLVIADWGATDERLLTQSIRKSLLSSLFGRLVAAGDLDLDATLADLGVDDEPPLTPAERQATVRDLLLSRSGIYRSALYEASGWKRRKPEPGADAPGERWFYNNWGFNALGTLFRQASGLEIGDAFDQWVARPIGMEDFRAADVTALTRDHLSERMTGNASDHPAYMFHLSSRDLARFGLLYAAAGKWAGRQVVPAEWVEESTFGAAQPTGWGDKSYGYMWWVMPPAGPFAEPTLVARGGRGHRLVVAPELDLVIVHRVPVKSVGLRHQLYRRFVWSPSVDDTAIDELVARLVAAHPDRRAAAVTAGRGPSDRPPASSPSPS